MTTTQYIHFSRKWKHVGSGAYSHYYKMNKRKGIKVLPKLEHETEFSAILRVHKEFTLLKAASATGYAPKPHKVVCVLGNGSIKWGIIMEHLDARRISDLSDELRQTLRLPTTVERHLDKVLRSVGVKHGDLHTGNILAKVKNRKITKVYAVDFSPVCSKFVKKRR